MQIARNIDVEDTVRQALTGFFTIYCRPLPKDFTVPSLLVTQVGGDDENTISRFDIVLDSRANDEATAMLNLRNAIGVLKAAAGSQNTGISYVTVNSSASWGVDPVRPELAMCSARLTVLAHEENAEVNES